MFILIQNEGGFIYKKVRELNNSPVPILTDLLNSSFISCLEKKYRSKLLASFKYWLSIFSKRCDTFLQVFTI